MNTYGKNWPFWMTYQGQKQPFGEAMRSWSLNRDGEIDPELQSKARLRN